MGIFFDVIIPIMTIFAAGFILQRIRPVSVKSVSAVTIYILSPALAFITLYNANFNKGFIIIIIFVFTLFYFMVLCIKILAKIYKWTPESESAGILTTGFMNSGNYGLPVVLFSVGQAALPYAVFIMVLQGLMNNFFGVYYASRSKQGIKYAVRNVLKMPSPYAAILGVLFQVGHVSISDSFQSMISMVGDAAIPAMMIVLGMQMGSLTNLKLNWQVIRWSVFLKMILAPLFAYTFILIVDMDPILAMVLVIVAAMPTAAATTMYAIEFDTEPELVSTITLISTLVSIVTVSVVLNIIL